MRCETLLPNKSNFDGNAPQLNKKCQSTNTTELITTQTTHRKNYLIHAAVKTARKQIQQLPSKERKIPEQKANKKQFKN